MTDYYMMNWRKQHQSVDKDEMPLMESHRNQTIWTFIQMSVNDWNIDVRWQLKNLNECAFCLHKSKSIAIGCLSFKNDACFDIIQMFVEMLILFPQFHLCETDCIVCVCECKMIGDRRKCSALISSIQLCCNVVMLKLHFDGIVHNISCHLPYTKIVFIFTKNKSKCVDILGKNENNWAEKKHELCVYSLSVGQNDIFVTVRDIAR